MDQEKSILEDNWRQVKHLLEEKERELASAEAKHAERVARMQELEKQLAILSSENDRLLQGSEEMKRAVEAKNEQIQGHLDAIDRLQSNQSNSEVILNSTLNKAI